jgi:hypothetical protein
LVYKDRTQSYDFWFYNYNVSVVVAWSVFQSVRKKFFFKSQWATLGVVNFYSAGVVTRDRRIFTRSVKAYKMGP